MELYVHIPFCVKKCKYCDFLSGPSDRDTRKKYTKALLEELKFYAGRCSGETVSSVFIGGGTPTFLENELMEQILDTINSEFRLKKDSEFTIECNPGTAGKEAFLLYHEKGINRLSIGLQSANEEELHTLGRIHDFKAFLRTFENARKAGFDNINVDLMTGIPGQDIKSLQKTLYAVTILRPEHISAYDLIIEPGTPFYELYKKDLEIRKSGIGKPEFLPDEELEYALTSETERYLKEKGYIQYEISNFSRDGMECLHNTGYWDRVPYIGAGLGASSFYNETRWNNTGDIWEYIDSFEKYNSNSSNEIKMPWEMAEPENAPIDEKWWRNISAISRKAAMEEFFFLGLRKINGVKRADFQDYFGITPDAIYSDVFKKLKNGKFLTEKMGIIALTKRGMDVSNEILAEFLLD